MTNDLTHLTSTGVLERIETIPGWTQSRGVLSSDVQRILTHHEDTRILAWLAGCPGLDPGVQDALLGMESEVRTCLASNPDLVLELQDELWVSGDLITRKSLATNVNLQARLQHFMVEDPEVNVDLAFNPGMVLEVQAHLASNPDAYVRTCLAMNEGLAEETQVTLSKDPQGSVRRALAENKRVTPGENLGARFLHEHHPATYERLTRGYDPEMLKSLVISWNGSLKSLKEAVELVEA